jgi:hypothetical protein
MTFDKLSNREQVLIFIVVATFVAGGYGLFRFVPQLKKLTELQANVIANKEKVKNPQFPDEPMDDIEDLKDKTEALEADLENLHVSLDSVSNSLAPTDSQEMILKISEAARSAGVRVIESVPYLVQKKEPAAANDTNQQKLSKRAQKKLNKSIRKANGANAASGASGSMPKEGELIYRLVNELENPRPFQYIGVEGTFVNLQKFIQNLRNLPWQATIVKLDIDVSTQTSPQGLPQLITAKMIVAM